VANEGIIAIDLGAESGRVVLGALKYGTLWTEEVHRFTHRPVPTPAGLCWDLTGLWNNILEGLRRAVTTAEREKIEPKSVGVDTWGVDWTIVSPVDTIRGLPRAYRCAAFPGSFEKVLGKVPAEKIYEATGIQLMAINTLYQYALGVELEPERFEGGRLAFMPDLLHWLLSGKVTNERTIASTSQMLDARTGDWATELLQTLRLPQAPLSKPIAPGTRIGSVTKAVSTAIGCQTELSVIAPPSHDTAAAVAAVPADSGSTWAYLSSGTWSLLGAELDAPIITPESAAANFTNELGVNNTVRFLKNIAGLWLVQETRRALEKRGQSYDYPHLVRLAEREKPFRTLIAANHPNFIAPGNMIEAIQEYAKQTEQPIPMSAGELVRCCMESLALEYRRSLHTLQRLLGKEFDVLHIVGGGSKNALLNQMAADATGLPVCTGPSEATAMGNLLVQAMGLGLVKDLAELRAIVRRTAEPQTIRPNNPADWDAVAERYEALPQK